MSRTPEGSSHVTSDTGATHLNEDCMACQGCRLDGKHCHVSNRAFPARGRLEYVGDTVATVTGNCPVYSHIHRKWLAGKTES